MAKIYKTIGDVSAYAAVKKYGYIEAKDEREFAEQLIEALRSGGYAEQAAQSASDAESAKDDAESAKDQAEAMLSVIASEFNSSVTYPVGSYCFYEGDLYECVEEHTGAWNGSHFSQAVVGEQLADLRIELDDAVSDIAAVKSDLNETEVELVHTGTSHSNALNNAYVWVLTTPIPKGAVPSLTVIGDVGATWSYIGDMTVYFFEKNSNNTYTVKDSVSLTTVAGNNVVSIPEGLTDDSDIYVGVYSQDGGIGYSTSGQHVSQYTRCAYGDIASPQITMSGSYNMDFSMQLSYIVYTSYLDILNEKIETLENKSKVVIVDPSGNGDYTTIIDAINTEAENTVIFIKPGVYNQDMTACLKKRIILIGADRNQCIIRDTDGRYGHHPLYVSCGYFENLTVEAPYVSGVSQEIGVSDLGAYAVHIDTDDDYGVGKQIEFYHCNISSDFFPAMGCGLRKDMTLIIDDCVLSNDQIANRGDYSDEGSLGALYFHDSNGKQGNQYIILKNSVLKSKLQYAMCPYQVSRNPQNNRVYCDFINNVLYSDVGKYSDTVWFRGDPFNPSNGIFSIGIGYGNSIASLNNN